MIIEVGDIECKIITRDVRAVAFARQVCRARPSGYQFMPRYKKGYWDGYISLMYGMTRFPTGLLPLVIRNLSNHGYNVDLQYDVETIGIVNPVKPDMLNGITLRDYQINAITELLTHRRGIAKMATNAGKTEVMAGIIKALDCRTVVLVQRKELMYQTAERFLTRGIESVGYLGDGKWIDGSVIVAMIQTLANKDVPLVFPDNKMVMIDECHHGSSEQYMDVIKNIGGSYRYGFSGTPLKYDLLSDLKLISNTGEVLVDVSNKFLIDAGYSANPVINVVVVEDKDRKLWKKKYPEAYAELVVDYAKRNVIIAGLANKHKNDGTVLIMVQRIEHGNILSDLIPGSVFVHGSHDMAFRKSVLAKMRDGGGIFIATPIFDEGIDVPALDVVVLAGCGSSHVNLLQRIGRGLRKKDNKGDLIVYDFLDDTNVYLFNQCSERIAVYEQEGFRTKIIKV